MYKYCSLDNSTSFSNVVRILTWMNDWSTQAHREGATLKFNDYRINFTRITHWMYAYVSISLVILNYNIPCYKIPCFKEKDDRYPLFWLNMKQYFIIIYFLLFRFWFLYFYITFTQSRKMLIRCKYLICASIINHETLNLPIRRMWHGYFCWLWKIILFVLNIISFYKDKQ